MPKVSVIVPNYNYGRFLSQRMESILSQTFQDMEIILLDDCSTDNSQAILSQYTTHPLVSHIVFNEKNSGSPFAQWQKGIDLAQGEYIWIAESDDYCEPTLLATLVDSLNQYPTAAIAFAGAILVDENGNSIEREFDYWHKHEDCSIRFYSSKSYFHKLLMWRCSVYNASGALFRRDLYLHIDKRYATLRYCADWLFWIEMTLCGDVVEIRKKLNRFRMHTDSVTARFEKTKGVFEEQLIIAHRLWSLPFINRYRLSLARGAFYKKVKRMFPDAEHRKEPMRKIKALGVKHSDYLLERIIKSLHQVCPFLYHL